MTIERFILSTGFSFDRMLEMSAAEARKYYLLNFFTPVAYEMLSSATADAFVVLLIKGVAPKLTPVFLKGASHVDTPVGWGSGVPAGETITHFERITGSKPDEVAHSKALVHAFGHLTERNPQNYLPDLPVIASLANSVSEGKNRMLLSVLVPDKKAVSGGRHGLGTGVSRATAMSVAGAAAPYANRAYNSKTGQWIGLCDPTSPTCCEACKAIYRSPGADNYLDAV